MFWNRKPKDVKRLESRLYLVPKKNNISVNFSLYDTEKKIRGCRTYLESLSVEKLVDESHRVSNFIRYRYTEFVEDKFRGKILNLDFIFPLSVDSKTGLFIGAFDFQTMVGKVIKERSEREQSKH